MSGDANTKKDENGRQHHDHQQHHQFSEDDARRYGTEAQIKAIEDDIKANQPLTSDTLPIAELVRMYEVDASEHDSSSPSSSSFFLRGAKYLAGKYLRMRKVRGDGNCYYRAFLYALCESLLSAKMEGGVMGAETTTTSSGAKTAGSNKSDDGSTSKSTSELERLSSFAKKSLDEVSSRGYDRSAIEMFHEELVDLFDYLSSPLCTHSSLHSKLTEENSTSDYCTWYLRVITACFLKSDPDRFVHFLDEPYVDVSTFCSREVEPMGKECGMVQVLALAEAMGVGVAIEYLDGRDFEDGRGLARHEFGPSPSAPPKDGVEKGEGRCGEGKRSSGWTEITLLYRPGHYDILYKE